MDHLAGKCPVCKKPFKDGDDVVICPSCGAPYHRECYHQAGHCLFEDKHSPTFEYKDPDAPPAPPERRNDGGVLCPNCNTANDSRNIFCENCGYPLHEHAGGAQPGGQGQQTPPPPPPRQEDAQNGPFGGFAQPPGYAEYVDLSGQIDGISKRDWAEFIGSSAPIYLYRLSIMQERGRKISFMLSAFFLTPCYFAYRKMWGWTAVALLTTFLSYLTYIFSALAGAGISALPFFSIATMLQTTQVLRFIWWGINMVFGLFALQLYRKSTVKKMQGLRTRYQSDFDYHIALGQQGGVSILGVVVVVALVFAFAFTAVSLMDPGTVQALYNALGIQW